MQVLDRKGRGVRESQAGETEIAVDTEGLEPGAYLLRVARAPGVAGVTIRSVPPAR